MTFQAISTSEKWLEEFLSEAPGKGDVRRLHVVVMSYCISGWPEYGTLPRVVKPSHSINSQVCIEGEY